MRSDDEREALQAWDELAPAARRSLELAHTALSTGGLAVGSALAEAGGHVVAAGRNRAYDPGGGMESLQGTPLAHAEMNVLATVATDRDLSTDTLWSTQQPCSMCDAALAFTGVGTVRWLSADPWARASGVDERRAEDGVRRVGPADERWLVVATVLFLASIALTRGATHATVERNRELEPEIHALLQELLAAQDAAARITQPLPALLPDVWNGIRDCAAARHDRTARGGQPLP